MSRVLAVVDKEWAETIRNRLLLVTVFILPAVFLLMPILTICLLPTGPVDEKEVAHLVQRTPQLAGLDPRDVLQIVLVNQFLLLYLLMPSIIPMTVAAFSIIGEKQARSLEPLLAAPLSTGEILVGKALAAIVPAVVVTWISYGLFISSSFFLTSPVVWLAIVSPMWLLAMVVLSPLLAVVSVFVGVIVSSRVNDTRVAQQVSGFLVLPIVGFAVAQTAGAVLLSVEAFSAAALVLAAVGVGVFALAIRLFQRDRILTQWR